MNNYEYEKIIALITSKFKNEVGEELKKNYFGSRLEFNREKLEVLKKDKDFRVGVKRIRKEFNIPELIMEDDMLEIPGPKYTDMKSDWLERQSKLKQKRISKAISTLLNQYELPFYYDEWLAMHILYKHPISEAPLHRLDYGIASLVKHSDDLSRIQPTTQEKRLLKEIFRKIFKIKGKPTKDKAELYQQFLKALLQVGNKQRRSRTMGTSLKTLGHKKTMKVYDFDRDKSIEHKKTFKDLVMDAYDDKEIKHVSLETLVVRLRKQKQRLLKRHSRLKKVEK